jgi:hypothetical protein
MKSFMIGFAIFVGVCVVATMMYEVYVFRADFSTAFGSVVEKFRRRKK